MFNRESDMSPIVERWLKSEKFAVMKEFRTCEGIADLVGCRLDPDRSQARLELGQRRALGGLDRVKVWLQVPDDEPMSLGAVQEACSAFMWATEVEHVLGALCAARLVEIDMDGRLMRCSNDWHPLQARIVAVELKLSKVSRAFTQARCYSGFADESFVAFPMKVAKRVAADEEWEAAATAHIGILGVTDTMTTVLRSASPPPRPPGPQQTHAVEYFWVQWLKSAGNLKRSDSSDGGLTWG